MKKNYVLLTALTLAALCACQNESEMSDNQQNESGMSITASMEDAASRTALQQDENGENLVVWSESDELSVFLGTTANNKFTYTSGEGSTEATFTGSGNLTISGSIETESSYANVAYYPYAENVSMTNTDGGYEVSATFPQEQAFVQNSFAKGVAPMVAVTTDKADLAFPFKNVGGLLKFKLTGNATITGAMLHSKSNKLAGNYTIEAANGTEPTLAMGTDAVSAITMNCGESGMSLNSHTDGAIFVFVVPPATYAAGDLTFTFYTSESKYMTYSNKEAQTLARSASILFTQEYSETGSGTTASDATSLSTALAGGGLVALAGDIEASSSLTVDQGTTLDLAGHTISSSANKSISLEGGVLEGANSNLSTDLSSTNVRIPIIINTSGGTVKNLTIDGNNKKNQEDNGTRGIYIDDATTDVVLENVTIKGVNYALNTTGTFAENVKLEVKNSALFGWTSYADFASASFTDCYFGFGTYYSEVTYNGYFKPYKTTVLENCTFEKGYGFDFTALHSGCTVTFKNCKVKLEDGSEVALSYSADENANITWYGYDSSKVTIENSTSED